MTITVGSASKILKVFVSTSISIRKSCPFGVIELELVNGGQRVYGTFLPYSCNLSVNLKLFQHKKLKIKTLVPKMNEIGILARFLSGYHIHLVNIFYLYVLIKAYLPFSGYYSNMIGLSF